MLRRLSADGDLWAGQGDDVIALHGPDGRFSRVSASAAQVLGRSAREVVGLRLTDIVTPAEHGLVLRAMGQAASEGRARFDATATTPDGARPVEISLSRTARGLRSVIRDAAERAADRDALEAAAARAARDAQKRNDHLVNVSHEIRTPLSAVIGFADALRRESFGAVGEAQVRDYARVIHDSGQHLLSLVTDLLDLSKAEAVETLLAVEGTDVAELVARCCDIVRLQTEEAGLTLDVFTPPGLPTLLLDPKLVRQILLNLLSNAMKFTAEGGLSVGVLARGDTLTIEVCDTGIGMSPGDLALVGQRFKQARREGVRGTRGTGIGLSLAHALARVHGGELTLTSAEGRGTTATLSLPLVPADGAGVTAPALGGEVVELASRRRA